jgi:hypothetical protein
MGFGKQMVYKERDMNAVLNKRNKKTKEMKDACRILKDVMSQRGREAYLDLMPSKLEGIRKP